MLRIAARPRYGRGMSPNATRSDRRRFSAAPLIALATIAGGGLPAQADAAGAPDRGGEPRVLWKYAPDGARFSGVVADRGVVFALDRAGRIHALEAPTGEVLWTTDEARLGFDYGYGLALSSRPGFDALLVGCDDGLLALDRATGAVLWHTETPFGVAGPACTGELAVAGGADGKVYGCELLTGRIRWRHDFLADRPEDPAGFSGDSARFGGRPARPAAAAADGEMVVVPIFDQCRALALDAATGERLWAFPTQGWMYGRPAIGPRLVYLASQDRHFYAVDKVAGKLAWKVGTRGRNEAAAALTERFAYFGSCDARLYAVDHGVGKVQWRFPTEHAEGRGAPIYSRPLVMGDAVYLAAMRGKIYAVDRDTGELIWKFCPLPESEPNSDLVTDGGLLFVTTRKSGDDAGQSAVLAITVR